jgi:hypothetical protein
MGNTFVVPTEICACFETDSEATLERTEQLLKGSTFVRKVLMGMSSQKVYVRLGETKASVVWRVEKADKSWIPGTDEYGEIDLHLVSKVKSVGKQGMEFEAKVDGASLFNVTAEDVGTRDAWVLGLGELLEKPLPKHQARATATSDKSAYYDKRQTELEQRKKEREERKQKYMEGTNGMKFTAQAMLNRK